MLNLLSKRCRQFVRQTFERMLKQMLSLLKERLVAYECLVIVNQGLKIAFGSFTEVRGIPAEKYNEKTDFIFIVQIEVIHSSYIHTDYRSNKLKTQEPAFEEEGCIFNLHIKRRSFTKHKAYPFNLENDEKTGISRAIF